MTLEEMRAQLEQISGESRIAAETVKGEDAKFVRLKLLEIAQHCELARAHILSLSGRKVKLDG